MSDPTETEAVLALARAYRAGTEELPRDLGQCFECYRRAAELGSAEAEYSLALFYFAGGVVPRDTKQGLSCVRAAADLGSVDAKVYLANLYQSGIHYAQDDEKADVWHRSAARSAGIDAEPGSPEHARAMAELGCVRYGLELSEQPDVTEAERERWLDKARAHGCHAVLRRSDAEGVAVAGRAGRSRAASRPEARAWIAAFFYASLFMTAALGAGWLCAAAAMELPARGRIVPFVGADPFRSLWGAAVLLGVLPTLLVYRVAAVLRAVVVGAFGGVFGHVAWGTSFALLAQRSVQSLAFSAGAFLTALLILGWLGGAKLAHRSDFHSD
jgi:hypothetical protein